MLGYEILTGSVPFAEYQGARLTVAHFTEMPPPAHEIRAEIPEALSRVLEKGMAKEPSDRFPNAAGFRDALGTRW
jgi:serine/threonine-protein kinase